MSKSICMFQRRDSDQFPGGDSIQIKAICGFLQRQGHEVKIAQNWNEDLTPFDVVLIFNLTRPIEAYLQAKQALRYSKPYIVFSVYWNLDSLQMKSGLNGLAKMLLPDFVKSFIRFYKYKRQKVAQGQTLSLKEFSNSTKMIREVLQHAVFICPNSLAEQQHVINHFQLNESIQSKMRVICNGIDTMALKASLGEDVPIELPESFICCVGGIGPRKNQLQLVQAAQLAGIPLVIVGKASPGAESYYRDVLAVSGKHVKIISNVPQAIVFGIMRRSSGHIQPSYIETPGLASLEAGSLGCPIGVSEVAPVREYFGEYALYCDPSSVESIAKCMKELFLSPASEQLSRHINKNYDWNNVLIPLEQLIHYIEK